MILRLPPPAIDAVEFEKVVSSRRSVRVFNDEPIPEQVTKKILQYALMAPNSSNLQTWEVLIESQNLKLEKNYKSLF